MKKFSLLLLDANVVIVLCKMGLWDHVLQRCEILLARTVVDESSFYINDSGEEVYFSLDEDEQLGRLKVVEFPATKVLAFKAQFAAQFAGEIDPGEAEALAYLASADADHFICSADKIVFRVLGCLGKGEQGCSLEVVLQKCGLTKKLPQEFGEDYRRYWTNFGGTEMIQGRALKNE